MCLHHSSNPHLCVLVRKWRTGYKGNRSIRFPSWRFMEAESGSVRGVPDDHRQCVCHGRCYPHRGSDRTALCGIHGALLPEGALQSAETCCGSSGRDPIHRIRVLWPYGHRTAGAGISWRQWKMSSDLIGSFGDHDPANDHKCIRIEHSCCSGILL